MICGDDKRHQTFRQKKQPIYRIQVNFDTVLKGPPFIHYFWAPASFTCGYNKHPK